MRLLNLSKENEVARFYTGADFNLTVIKGKGASVYKVSTDDKMPSILIDIDIANQRIKDVSIIGMSYNCKSLEEMDVILSYQNIARQYYMEINQILKAEGLIGVSKMNISEINKAYNDLLNKYANIGHTEEEVKAIANSIIDEKGEEYDIIRAKQESMHVDVVIEDDYLLDEFIEDLLF